MDKQFEIQKIRSLQKQIEQTIRGWSIFESQISGTITGVGFWLDEAVAALESTPLFSETPVASVDEAALNRVRREEKRAAELEIKKLEELQNV